MNAAPRNPRAQIVQRKSRDLRSAFARLTPAIVLVGLFSLLINLLRLTTPLYLMQVLDRVLSSESEETLVFITLIAIGALLTWAIMTGVCKMLLNRTASWFESRLYAPVTKAYLAARLTDPERGQSLVKDLFSIRQFLSGQIMLSAFEVPWSVIFLLIIYYFDIYLGLFATGIVLIQTIIAVLNDLSTSAKQQEFGKSQAEIDRNLRGAVSNIDTIYSMGMLGRVVQMLQKMGRNGGGNLDAINERGGIFNTANRFVRTFAQIGILALGAYLILEGEITTGAMIGSSILQNLALSPIDQAMNAIRSFKSFRSARQRIDMQLARFETVADAIDMPADLHVDLGFRQAMFMPQGAGKPVLRPLQLDIRAGEMVGVLGPSGAGKSLICRLAIGALRPTSGSVLVNDLDVHKLQSDEFGSFVGYLPQTPGVMHGTIADNIARFHPADDEHRAAKIVDAAKLAGINDKILSLRDRYETVLDEEGLQLLSRSQLQQVFVARALYGRPRLIVLDEPATFLDRAGEEALMQALNELKAGGSTLLVVSQRPNFINQCDKVLLVRDGVAVDFGEPQDVLDNLSEPRAQQPRIVDGSGGMTRRKRAS